jgi:hypothetical protein
LQQTRGKIVLLDRDYNDLGIDETGSVSDENSCYYTYQNNKNVTIRIQDSYKLSPDDKAKRLQQC